MLGRRATTEILRQLSWFDYPQERHFSPQRYPKHNNELLSLRVTSARLRAYSKKAPKRGFATSGIIQVLHSVNTEIQTLQAELYQAQANITQKEKIMSPTKFDFTFISLEMTDSEMEAYEKWAAKMQQDFHTVIGGVLLDDVKLSVSLNDDVYYATLVGQKNGAYEGKGLTARSGDLFDAILLVCYKHVEILGGKWVTRKSKRDMRG